MITNQKDIFIKSEGDKWFDRNVDSNKINSIDTLIAKKYVQKGDRVLEIGCADGTKLNLLGGGFGIDPSEKAIKEGATKYPDLNLSVGTSDNLFFQANFFDIVIFGFCLYLVDRNLIFRTLAEADRVLKNNGFLIITDFDSPLNVKKKYHHLDGIFTYKQQYEKLFLSSPIYTLVEKKSYSHYGFDFHPDIDERVATTVLHKNIDSAYAFI